MNREATIATLLGRRADDVRRLGLDAADLVARQNRTWGTPDHRKTRDGIEKSYDEARRSLERLSDDELTALVAANATTS